MKEKRLIHDVIADAAGDFDLSTAVVRCGDFNPNVVANEFSEIFGRRFDEAVDALVSETKVPFEDGNDPDGYYPFERGWNPLSETSVEVGRFVLRFSPLLIPYCYGEFCELAFVENAVFGSFAELESKFSGISYGFVADFPWADRRCGDVSEYFAFSGEVEADDVLPYMWKTVDDACGDEDFVELVSELVDGIDEEDLLELVSNVSDAVGRGWLSGDGATTILSKVFETNDEDEYSDECVSAVAEAISENAGA